MYIYRLSEQTTKHIKEMYSAESTQVNVVEKAITNQIIQKNSWYVPLQTLWY